MSTTLTPQHITLLLKNSTHTIFVSLLPTAPLSSIKEEVLEALASRNITELSSAPVPSKDEVDRVELGLALDRKDYTKGFTLLREQGDLLGFDDEATNKGKGKMAVRKSSASTVVNNTVAGAGFKDGDVVAFRFKDGKNKPAPGDADYDVLNELEAEDDWNVVFPTLDDEEMPE